MLCIYQKINLNQLDGNFKMVPSSLARLFRSQTLNKQEWQEYYELYLKTDKWKQKKFDVVIMNPPYQVKDGGGGEFGSSAVPIYHKFIEKVIDELQPDYLVSINPSRWMVGGKGLDNFRERMINDKKIKKIVHFPGDREVFHDVSITGGVNYFLWDKRYDGKCEFIVGNTSTKRFLNDYDIILQDNNAISILEKIRLSASKWVNEHCFGRNPFGLATNFSDWKPNGTPCYSVGEKKGTVKICYSNIFTDKYEIINKWKVCASAGNGAAQKEDEMGMRRILSTIFIVEPNAICTDS
jgi:site-specific DNA-methyltransferase (adenine-specific)